MNRFRLICSVLTMAFCAVRVLPAAAQQRPDFSGVWIKDFNVASGSARPAADVWQLVIEQDDDVLTLTQTMGPLEYHYTYYLDGNQSQNTSTTVTGEQW